MSALYEQQIDDFDIKNSQQSSSANDTEESIGEYFALAKDVSRAAKKLIHEDALLKNFEFINDISKLKKHDRVIAVNYKDRQNIVIKSGKVDISEESTFTDEAHGSYGSINTSASIDSYFVRIRIDETFFAKIELDNIRKHCWLVFRVNNFK